MDIFHCGCARRYNVGLILRGNVFNHLNPCDITGTNLVGRDIGVNVINEIYGIRTGKESNACFVAGLF